MSSRRDHSGLFGYLSEAWFDWDPDVAGCPRAPTWRIYLIGYGGNGRHRLPDNVTLLGRVDPRHLSAHAAHWDVGIIPFKPSTLAADADPIKAYEYLAMGLPVVSTGCPPPAGAEALVHRAEGAADFIHQVRRAAAEQGLVEARRTFRHGAPGRGERIFCCARSKTRRPSSRVEGPFGPMMRVLFVYRYLTLGGVESVLRSRLEGLQQDGIEAQAWFLLDRGGWKTFADVRDRVHVGGQAELEAHLRRFSPEIAASIDTEEVLRSLSVAHSTVIVECHSPTWNRLPPGLIYAPSATWSHLSINADVLQRFEPIPTMTSVCRPDIPAGGDSVVHPESDPIVLWVGRLDRLKNWEFFLRLAEGLLRRGSPAQYWIAGDTQDEGVVRQLYREAKERCLLPRLRWIRQAAYNTMPALYEQVRASGGLVVSTSRNESFGMAVAEAMAVGGAVLAPRQGPFPELIAPDETGGLYEPDDLASAQQNPPCSRTRLRVRLGKGARAAMASRFAPEVALKKFAAELRSIAAAGPG
jgi:glycosyltransferase involved in cell wall biosynthesis